MIRSILFSFLVLGTVTGQFDDEFEEEVPSTHVPHLLTISTVVEATMGETVNFPCEVDDLGDFVLLWKKGVSQVLFAGKMKVQRNERRMNIDGTSLKINSVQPKDSGEYICQITTTPPLEVSHVLNVLYPPTVKPQPREGFLTAKEGETVALVCEATGNPVPEITWKHAGRNYDVNGGSTFLISNVQKSASGEYECIADNSVGDPAKAIITVEVVSAPRIKTHPSDGKLMVKEGEAIEIVCEASGDPAPIVTWKRLGMQSDNKAQKGRDGDRIVISEADRTHAGTYECIANNTLGIFTTAVIDVQVLYPPEIKVPETLIHSGEGTSVNLTCTVKGEPMPTVIWKKKDGKVIHSNDHYHLRTSGHHHTLTVRHLKEDDYGKYECVASNTLKSVTQNIHIEGTPQVPVITSKPHGPHGNRFMLTWVVKSHTPIDEYSLMYRKKSDDEKWKTEKISSEEGAKAPHKQMFELKDLEPSTTYEATVTAKNKYGFGLQSEKFVFTTKHSERIHEPIKSVDPDESEETSSNEQRSGLSTDGSSTICGSWLAMLSVLFTICLIH